MSDVLAIYLTDIVPASAQPKKAIARVERLGAWWSDKVLSQVDSTNCRAYVKSHSKGGGRRDLEDLRAAINHHAKRDLHSGYIEVELPAKGKPRTKYLTRSEVAKLLWVCWRHTREQVPPRGPRKGQRVDSQGFHDLRHLARFILVGVYTGSRSTPILRASPFAASGRAFMDLDAMLYHRLPEDLDEADNKKSPTSRLGDRIAAHVRRWRDRKVLRQFVVEWHGRPIKSVKTAWKQAVALAQIPGRPTPHTLRHTAVTWLKQAGYSSFEVGQFVGMSERMVDEVYAKHDPSFQTGVANAFAAGRRIVGRNVGPADARQAAGSRK